MPLKREIPSVEAKWTLFPCVWSWWKQKDKWASGNQQALWLFIYVLYQGGSQAVLLCSADKQGVSDLCLSLSHAWPVSDMGIQGTAVIAIWHDSMRGIQCPLETQRKRKLKYNLCTWKACSDRSDSNDCIPKGGVTFTESRRFTLKNNTIPSNKDGILENHEYDMSTLTPVTWRIECPEDDVEARGLLSFMGRFV